MIFERSLIDHIREISLQEHVFRFQQSVSPVPYTSPVAGACLLHVWETSRTACMFTVSDGERFLLCFLCKRPIRNVDFVQNTKDVIGCSLCIKAVLIINLGCRSGVLKISYRSRIRRGKDGFFLIASRIPITEM